MFTNNKHNPQQPSGNSPIGLRDRDSETIDTYHPRMLIRQSKVNAGDNHQNTIGDHDGTDKSSGKPQASRWLPRMSTSSATTSITQKPKTLREKLSQKIARISSLDSTRSSSSMENDSAGGGGAGDHQQAAIAKQQVMPSISITASAPAQPPAAADNQQAFNQNQLRHRSYNDYYGRSRHGLAHDDNYEEDDDDYDEFDDPPLPIPYSSSSMSRSNIITRPSDSTNIDLGTTINYEDLLDDRQGMNNSEQQFTKGEKANRPSIDDGSIISELRSGGKKSSKGGKKVSRKSKQKRSKSPSSSSIATTNLRSSSMRSSGSRRSSKRGILSLASSLKLILIKKHESIEKLQLSVLNSGFVSLKTMDKDLQTFLPKERMSPKKFEERVKLMRKYEVLAKIEYRFASKYETYVCRHAIQESNQIKNNYKKCIPYDYNRVVLKTLPQVPDSDYINASHVDSHLKPNAYIAAQGPNENTIEDFWRMIWEQKTFVIVMLTKVFDFIRVMCNQYWPVECNKPERYGNLEITLLYEEPLADFVIRTIKVTKLKGGGGGGGATGKLAAGEKSGAEAAGSQQQVPSGEKNPEDEVRPTENYEEYSDDDDTSASDYYEEEELTLNEQHLEQQTKGRESTTFVRAPKYVSKPISERRRTQLRKQDRLSSATNLDHHHDKQGALGIENLRITNETNLRHSRSSSQPPASPTLKPQKQLPPNEFLLPPLLNASSRHLANSTSSLSSACLTPMTPRTPSSAGLDRSSATRRAVKKKRRPRAEKARPMRTQFQVPSESQLIDDDDDDVDEEIVGDNNLPSNQDNFQEEKLAERIIYQFHYHSWHSHTCPFISSLLHFRRRVRICMDEMSKSGKTGPTIVHCNDGCGRTGTYLAIDANLELGEEDNVYDVFNYTKKMRQSRKFLIDNLEQYKFVYDTIEEAMFCGRTWFPVSELHKQLKHKSQRNPLTKKNEYQREYEKLQRMTSKFSIGDCAGGHRVENRQKNRDVSIVPPDNFRPYLTSYQSNDNTDYINAVFVDGYTRSKEYIVTEWPIQETIGDFWSLIYDLDCNSVILLANPNESSTYPSFMPNEKIIDRVFGKVFTVKMLYSEHQPNIKSWYFNINKQMIALADKLIGMKAEDKTTRIFQITCWPQGHRVPTSTKALVELMNIVECWRQRSTYGPVLVVSLNGKSRAGVYCAANVAIEQVVQHSEVDVFQAVKTVRRHRPQLIENMTEYKYCYDLILHYVLHYVNQASTIR